MLEVHVGEKNPIETKNIDNHTIQKMHTNQKTFEFPTYTEMSAMRNRK